MRGVILALLAALAALACRTPSQPALPIAAPIAPPAPKPRHCMRPPPVAPEMTGDETIDRHRRDWHRERLIAWSIGAYEACRPVGAVVEVQGR